MRECEQPVLKIEIWAFLEFGCWMLEFSAPASRSRFRGLRRLRSFARNHLCSLCPDPGGALRAKGAKEGSLQRRQARADALSLATRVWRRVARGKSGDESPHSRE